MEWFSLTTKSILGSRQDQCQTRLLPWDVFADLTSSFTALGLDVNDAQIDTLSQYRDRLATAEHNLTSNRDRAELDRRHISESLAFGRLLFSRGFLNPRTRMLDVGAGGGLPGIPIKIAWPSVRVTLLESKAKKAQFMQRVIDELHLDGAEVLEGRAETLAHHPSHREAYDVVVARAVAPLPVLLEYTLPFLRNGASLAAIKGSAAPRELAESQKALAELGGRLTEAVRLADTASQTVLIIEKRWATPEHYPRRPGIPSKRPII
jgi:16S rRNA (guanine527-N7)-methyltransferase